MIDVPGEQTQQATQPSAHGFNSCLAPCRGCQVTPACRYPRTRKATTWCSARC